MGQPWIKPTPLVWQVDNCMPKPCQNYQLPRLYSNGGRWRNEYGTVVEWQWQWETAVFREKCPMQARSHMRQTFHVWQQAFKAFIHEIIFCYYSFFAHYIPLLLKSNYLISGCNLFLFRVDTPALNILELGQADCTESSGYIRQLWADKWNLVYEKWCIKCWFDEDRQFRSGVLSEWHLHNKLQHLHNKL
jgi:hypothetical protein